MRLNKPISFRPQITVETWIPETEEIVLVRYGKQYKAKVKNVDTRHGFCLVDIYDLGIFGKWLPFSLFEKISEE